MGAHRQEGRQAAGDSHFWRLLFALAFTFILPALAQAQSSGGFTALAAGAYHSCGLRTGGSALCWGRNSEGQTNVPAGETFIALSTGDVHNCGLRADGSARCWGYNGFGQTDVPDGEAFIALAAGQFHSCGLRADGSALCWGRNNDGQSSVPAGEVFTALVASARHTCGLRANGSALCWGYNVFGQTSVPTGEAFTALSAGVGHTCGLRADGSALCWGRNFEGQTNVPAGGAFTALSAGAYHTCGLRADGSALCWGNNELSQTEVPAGEAFTALAAGYGHNCGLRADGSALCWGYNSNGQTDAPDVLAPAISAAADKTPNEAGWFRNNVKVTWTCFDADSGVLACPPTQSFRAETTTEGVLTPAYVISDNAGNQSAPSNQLTIRIDKTNPQIAATPTTEPNEHGWYTGDVTLHYECTDALSGIASCPDDTVITRRGAAVKLPRGKAVDVAGNTATLGVVTLDIDSNKPKISSIEFSGPLVVGASVTASAVAEDPQSGIVSSVCDPVDTSKARKRGLTCTVTNGAGLVATKKVYYTVTAE